MMKKWIAATMIAAGMATVISAGAMAESTHDVEVQGVAFDIPEQFKDLLTVETEGLGEGELVKVSETASLEAAAKQESGNDGAGWLSDHQSSPDSFCGFLVAEMLEDLEAEVDGAAGSAAGYDGSVGNGRGFDIFGTFCEEMLFETVVASETDPFQIIKL